MEHTVRNGLKERPDRPYFILAGLLCFTLGCFYVLDIRIDGPAAALGLNAFKWLHISLLAVAVCMGAAVPTSEHALHACAVMIISEIAGILIWVGYILVTDPDNNLWPVGLILFSGCGAIVICTGVLLGFQSGKPMRKKRSTGESNNSS
jgi:hypothetical protein